jgi:hypothetical protein
MENETTHMIDAAAPAASDVPAVSDDQPVTAASTTPPPVRFAPVAARKPNKFMADLTKAMQAAAENARADAMARIGADAKTYIETINETTATEAVDLRKLADDDVAAIRDWSKSEIARIREETDERISHRKASLEREIEAHAASIAARVERVQERVSAFEAQMTGFFERLLAEEDPTRFASMAESLPEPPSFDSDEPIDIHGLIGDTPYVPAERAVVIEPWPETEAVVETPVETAEAHTDTTDATDASLVEVVAETEAEAQPVADEAPASEVEAVDDQVVTGADAPDETTDPRLSALGLTPDFAAAEADAAAFSADVTRTDESIPVIADDALAARLAGLVPDADGAPVETASTKLVVTGLVSVASIAGFKRHLSRVVGVQSVGVSSGPEGEFIFAVSHNSSVSMKDVVATLPGFAARVTADADGELTVSARDPETEG